jgi:acid stress-induced BolA-like protein IbaG/YrbA
MVTPQNIEAWLREGLDCQHVEVSGDGHHFEAFIVSAAFRGKSRVQQHQAVYRALGARMQSEIHALSMQTLTPEQWAERRTSAAGSRGG